MKRKFFSVLLALVLVLSFSLVTAAPAMAATAWCVDDSATGAGDGTSKTDAFTTIQAAIDDGSTANGDTIKVYPGDYPEDLAISKSLTLTGVTEAGANNWTVGTAGVSSSVNITYDGSTAHMIGINADDVTFQGFTIDMVNTSAVRGLSFQSLGAGTTDNATIQYNHFSLGLGDSDRAINVSDDNVVTDFTVTYNTFTGTSWGNWIAIDSNAGISGTNVFSYNVVQGTSQLTAWVKVGSRDVEDITFDNNSLTYAVNIGEETVGSSNAGEMGDILITNNTFTGDPSTQAVDLINTLEDDDFEGGSFTADDVIVNYNDFSGYLSTGGDTVRNGINDGPTGSVNATLNWWGSANGPTVSSNTFNVGSQGADVGADVTYWPWYDTDMTENSFSPVKNTTDTPDTEFSSIQAAIDASTTANTETITAVAGTYTEALDIDKQLTLTGRNLADTANSWTVGTAGASVATVNITYDATAHMIGINEDSVTIQGFHIDTVNTASRGIFWTGDRSDSIIQYCSFDANDGDVCICLSDDKTATDFTVTYNTFTGTGESAGICWFGLGTNGGCTGTNVVSYNEVTCPSGSVIASGNDIGNRNIEDITYSYNSLSHAIWFTETGADGGKIGDIVIVANTFAGAPSSNAVQFLVSVDNADFEGGAFGVTDVVVYYNDFSGYLATGGKTVDFAVTSPSANLDARYNYWGTALDGPYHATTNLYGTGGDVSDNVTYEPWIYKTLATTGDTTPEIYSNEVPAYANSVDLSTGWNTFSVPIGLDGQYNNWAELYTLTSANYSMAYRFNPATQTFVSLATTDTYALAPGEGLYIKMNVADSIPYAYSTAMSVPSRSLSADWNLISGGMTTRTDLVSCASIAESGGTAGYSHVVSPAENAASWLLTAGATTAGNFVAGEGYWVFLPIARTLGLFDLTPAAWVALP